MSPTLLQFRTKTVGDERDRADNARHGIVCIRFPPAQKIDDDCRSYHRSNDIPLPPAA